ncbi:leucine zipper domain-containing protein [Micromonospora sp. BRA006-A]|nr:leucine zipper domain-containing protein [Micromonospora sp. BRA006-A]
MNAAEFAREHGVSVRTVYRHRARIQAEGQWQERSRRPRSSPRVTPPEVDAWICKLRAELGPDNGADFIRDALDDVRRRTDASWSVPSRSTVNRVLARHDLLVATPAKRPRSSWRRFSYARPRDCYQIDATEVKLADGRTVVVFDVLDDCTRTWSPATPPPRRPPEPRSPRSDRRSPPTACRPSCSATTASRSPAAGPDPDQSPPSCRP